MIKPEKISNDVVVLLQKRLQDEFNAFYHYRAAENFCNNVGFFKAGAYFKAESDDELSHAKKLEQYLVDWNITPALPTIPAPKVSFKGLGEIIEKSYTIEYELYEAYEDNSSKIFKLNELCTFDFLQFFRTTQNKSVAEYSDMLNVLEGVNVDSKFEMLMVEKILFNK
jgi:ferritin